MLQRMTRESEIKQAREDISAIGVWLACAVLYAIFMSFAFTNPSILKGELGLLENTQVAFLVAALAIAIHLASRVDEKWLRWWVILICLGAFYLLTEETSWGQHYFGWEMAGIFESINDQGETNIHNASSWFDQKPRAILLFGMILGTMVHPLVKRFRSGRGLFDTPWWLAPTLVCLGPVVFSQIAALPERFDDVNAFSISVQAFTGGYRSSEMEEVFMYMFFITYLLSLGHRLKFRSASAEGDGPSQRPVSPTADNR